MAELSAKAVLKKIRTWIYCTFRIFMVLLNNLYCIPTYVVWCVLLHPIYFVNPDLYWRIEGQLFEWLLTMVAFWSYSAGYHIVETGDDIDAILDDETLVLVNHQSTSDVPLLMYAFSYRDGLLNKLNWVMDAVFQFTNFGIVSTLHGDFFINAGRTRREASLKDLQRYLKSKFSPRKRKWLVLFPEGGFLRKRKEASKRYAAKMNLPNLEHVTLPRLGALQTIINSLCVNKNFEPLNRIGSGDFLKAGHLKYIVDVTIAYPEGNPLDLGAVISGCRDPCEVCLHYKIYTIHEVPFGEPEAMQTWLYNRYIEKNNMLGHYYLTDVWNPEASKIDINKWSMQLRKAVDKAADANSNNAIKTPKSDDDDEVDRAPAPLSEWIDSEKPSSSSIHGSGKTAGNSGEEKLPRKNEKRIEDAIRAVAKRACIYDPLTETEAIEAAGRTLHLDLLRMLILHTMFIASTLFHWALIRVTINLTFGV